MERKGESLGVTKAFPAQPVTQTIVSAQLHPHWSNRNPWGGQAGAQIRSASKDRKQGRRVEGQLGVGAEQEKEQGRGRPWEWDGDAARGRLPPGWGAGSRHAAARPRVGVEGGRCSSKLGEGLAAAPSVWKGVRGGRVAEAMAAPGLGLNAPRPRSGSLVGAREEVEV